MRLEDIHNVYFIGIGGIGMSALARWFNHQGIKVAGYDRVATPLTEALEEEGIAIHYLDDVTLIPETFIKNREHTLVIFTPAIPKDHQEYNFLLENGFTVKKRAEVLGIITSSKYTIGVAGTHGKTTTSSMVAHIFEHSGKGCNAFVGGIMSNYDSNLIIGESNDTVIVEADEFDRSFLRLHPNVSIVTSVDADHLDIYGDDTALKKSFGDYIQRTGEEGKIYLNENTLDQLSTVETSAKKASYGFEKGDIRAENLRIENGAFVFDFVSDDHEINGLHLLLPGYHNVENAVAAIAVALAEEIDSGKIKEAMASYKGVKRRFEYLVKDKKHIYIDDYAHHPTGIRALVTALRALYPTKRLTCIFQPHLFSRTRDFVEGFAEELSKVDELILLDIYPAREAPIPGVSSEIIMEKISGPEAILCSKEDVMGMLRSGDRELIVTVGAGDIDTLVPQIAHYLRREANGVEA